MTSNITVHVTPNPSALDQPISIFCGIDPLPSGGYMNDSLHYFVTFVSPFFHTVANQSTINFAFLDDRTNGVPSTLRGFCTPFVLTPSGVLAGFGTSSALDVRIRG